MKIIHICNYDKCSFLNILPAAWVSQTPCNGESLLTSLFIFSSLFPHLFLMMSYMSLSFNYQRKGRAKTLGQTIPYKNLIMFKLQKGACSDVYFQLKKYAVNPLLSPLGGGLI